LESKKENFNENKKDNEDTNNNDNNNNNTNTNEVINDGGESFLNSWQSWTDKSNENNGLSFDWSNVDWSSGFINNEGDDNENNNNNNSNNENEIENESKYDTENNNNINENDNINREDNKIQLEKLQGEALETGDQSDETSYECNVKIYLLEKKSNNKSNYIEKGCGNLKINIHQDENQKYGRLLCRRDKIQNTILNVPILIDQKYEILQDSFIRFIVIERKNIYEEDKDNDGILLSQLDFLKQHESKDNHNPSNENEQNDKNNEDENEFEPHIYLIKTITKSDLQILLEEIIKVQEQIKKSMEQT